MEPKIHKTRTAVSGGDQLKVRDVADTPEDVFLDTYFEGDEGFLDTLVDENKEIEEEQKSRIEALKRAIDIAKLMSNVTTEDVIKILDKENITTEVFELISDKIIELCELKFNIKFNVIIVKMDGEVLNTYKINTIPFKWK